MTTEEFDNLTLRLAKADGKLYMSLEDYYSDVNSPTYSRNAAFRQLYDARLEQSKHLWADRGKVTEIHGNDTESVSISTESGEVRQVAPWDMRQSQPTDQPDREEESAVEETGSSTIIRLRTEE